jgi:hypothetical protein
MTMTTYKSFRLIAGAALLLASAQGFAADKQTVRPELAKPLQAAQTALQAKQYDAAQSALADAKKVGSPTPYESYVINKMAAIAAVGKGDYKGAAVAYEAVLNSPVLPAEEKQVTTEQYIQLVNASKDYAKAADAVQKYRAAGGTKPEILGILPVALYQAGKFKEAGAELDKQFAELDKAGKAPSEIQLQLAANVALKTGDLNAYTATLERIVAQKPNKVTWLDLIVRTAKKPGFSDKLILDMYRLRRATGTVEKGNEYMEAAQLALQAGFAGEAQAWVDEGYAKKLMGEGADAARHQRLKDLVAKKIAADKATLAEEEKAAAAQATGDALVNTGYNLVAYGQGDKGLALMDQGIKKGGLKLPDQAKLHLGYAQLLAGKKELAAKTFASVQGTDGAKNFARLWNIHIRTGGGVSAK